MTQVPDQAAGGDLGGEPLVPAAEPYPNRDRFGVVALREIRNGAGALVAVSFVHRGRDVRAARKDASADMARWRAWSLQRSGHALLMIAASATATEIAERLVTLGLTD